jgi:hypothetical protein
MNNKWIIEINVVKNNAPAEWLAVRPTGGKRYEYDTHVEAFQMLKICYGYGISIYSEQVRVRQLNDGE